MGLVGKVPPHLGNLSFLVDLDFRNSSFHGILPSELSCLNQLKLINCGFNNLTGDIPSWLGSLPKLAFLSLRGNGFSVETIRLTDNQLSGSIPKEFGNLKLLKELYLDSNKIEG
ncbi:LRR domain containing protein [Trema orientale]|uniref:LRR domain containing protein n=1 Tax=Trema orientale TaxID=63057 RepID=A0A2P5EQ00_TREOI|nr:LRR domain containing protein [Trema orientale]